MPDTLQRWWTMGWPMGRSVDSSRWVVLDCESSGLDVRRDRLLSVAAVALHFDAPGRATIRPGDSFEVLLRHSRPEAAPAKANILLHGIGVGAQQQGVEPARALQALRAYVGHSPLLAFHAAFDRALIDRACKAALGARLANPWLDLAPLAAALHPEVKALALDDWLAHFGIRCARRHQAAADAWATAELLLRLLPALRALHPGGGLRAAAAVVAQRRWLAR